MIYNTGTVLWQINQNWMFASPYIQDGQHTRCLESISEEPLLFLRPHQHPNPLQQRCPGTERYSQGQQVFKLLWQQPQLLDVSRKLPILWQIESHRVKHAPKQVMAISTPAHHQRELWITRMTKKINDELSNMGLSSFTKTLLVGWTRAGCCSSVQSSPVSFTVNSQATALPRMHQKMLWKERLWFNRVQTTFICHCSSLMKIAYSGAIKRADF